MAAQKFKQDQKVFAKVRGYPPWPARINAILDETPHRQKYQVYFYGTHETGTCKLDELYDYVETKEKYGKGVKRKNFADAMNEIELELSLTFEQNETSTKNVEVTTGPSSAMPTTENDSDDEGNLVIDETPAVKEKCKPADNAKVVTLKRKHSSSAETTEMPPAAEMTSRSGRKIKPKKFLDEPIEFHSTLIRSAKQRNSVKENTVQNEDHAKVRKNNDKEDVNSDLVELHWNTKQNVQELIDKSEQSELPKNVKRDFKKSIKKKADEAKLQQASADNENLELLKTEVRLLDADCRIKSSLSLNGAKCDDCLQAMDEILELRLNAVMLKKHPEVVDTVKKLKKYVGNLNQWKLPAQEEAVFLEVAKKIRAKADTMYNKFKSYFTIPNGKSFYEAYFDELEQFQQKTQNMSAEELYSTVKEDLIQ